MCCCACYVVAFVFGFASFASSASCAHPDAAGVQLLVLVLLAGWRFPALPGVRFLVLVAVKIGTWRLRL